MKLNQTVEHLASTMNIKMESMPAAASYTANGAAIVYGTLSLNEWLALLGAILGVLTFFLNMQYQRRREERERRREDRELELHRLRVMKEEFALNQADGK